MITIQAARAAISKDDNDLDGTLKTWTSQLTADIEQYCNQPLVSRSIVIEKNVDQPTVYDYPPSRLFNSDPLGIQPAMYSDIAAAAARLLVPMPFVAVPVSLTTAEYRTSVFDAYTTVSDVTLVTYNGAYHLARQAGFSGKGWRFTLTAGYTVTTDSEGFITASNVPADLQKALTTLLQFQFKLDPIGKSYVGLANIVESAQGANISTSIKPVWNDVKDALNNYRLHYVA